MQQMILLALALMIAPLSPTDTAVTTARAVDAHYNHLKSFRAAFTEAYTGPGVSRTENGILWLKKPGRMRWDYRQPREKLFLIDGQTAYFYVPGEAQARKTSVKNIDDIRSPLRYLLGKTKLEKELEALSLAPDVKPLESGNIVLRGIPKEMKDRVSDVVLEVSPTGQIYRIEVHEVDGTSTDFRFSNLEENISIQDSLFRFTPPAGVEMIQSNQAPQ
jgi:outer membrane lipoprotein carrier protein